MTLIDMVEEVKASLGNRTDITDQRYLAWLNWAYYDVCGFHKKKVFGPKIFKFLEGRAMLQTYLGYATCNATGSGPNTVRLVVQSGTPAVPVDEGWMLEVVAYGSTPISGAVAAKGNTITGTGFAGVVYAGYQLWSPDDYVTYTVESVNGDTEIVVSGEFKRTGTQNFIVQDPSTIPDGMLGQKAAVASAVANSATDFTATVVVSTGSDDTIPPNQWGIVPDNNTILLLRRKYYYIGIDIVLPLRVGMVSSPQYSAMRMWALDTIYYLKDGTELDHLNKEMLAFSPNTDTGKPLQFYRIDNTIVFDTVPDGMYQFVVLYYAYPRIVNYDGTGAWESLSYDIDDYWHEIIIKGAVWRGHQKLMEPDRAVEANNEYEQAMLEHFDSEHVEGKQQRTAVRVNLGGNGSYTISNNGSAKSQYDRSDFMDK